MNCRKSISEKGIIFAPVVKKELEMRSTFKICSTRQEHNEPSIEIPSLGLFDTSNLVYDPAEEEFRRRMQKKKKKRGPRL